ncbi:zinc-finger associated domain (zf-AD) domain-containing protein [Phthorimaea operculella]|nr:zinc-finger associated domain (zf-AD) domain-containing protein [Phthorimaea operculella]
MSACGLGPPGGRKRTQEAPRAVSRIRAAPREQMALGLFPLPSIIAVTSVAYGSFSDFSRHLYLSVSFNSKMAKKRGKVKTTRSPIVGKQPAMEAANGQSSPISVAASPIPVLAKVCRLCETKEGPFLNIFGGEKNTAKKIEELLPFGVAENDELPHKICFRCSAKVEELHEFVQKCIKTQENLYNYLGKKCPTTKAKTTRSLWEEKLNRSNITNDDICDAVIKKAMEGIKDIPFKMTPSDAKDAKIPEKSVGKSRAFISDISTKKPSDDVQKTEPEYKKKTSNTDNNKKEDLSVTEEKLNQDKLADKTPNKTRSSRSNNEAPEVPNKTRSSRSNNETPALLEGIQPKTKKSSKPVKPSVDVSPSKSSDTVIDKEKQAQPKSALAPAVQNPVEKDGEQYKPFDIMDHVSMIKVNGVGVLFQCKLCNRNFLKKEVVLSHWCAKNGAAKEDFIKRVAPPEPPKVVPTVKYINTKVDDVKKQQGPDNKAAQSKTNYENKEITETSEIKTNVQEVKKKPKIGPACKIKRTSDDKSTFSTAPESSTAPAPTPAKSGSVVEMPAVPSLNCRYKLVPGPNNTFTLVEAQPTVQTDEKKNVKSYGPKKRKSPEENEEIGDSAKKRKVLRSENSFLDKPDSSKSNLEIIDLEDAEDEKEISLKQRKVLRSESTFVDKTDTGITNLQDQDKNKTASQPYPVGLFQTVGRHSKSEKPPAPAIVPFATSAQKKQSYTVVQTGNPSKLLISAKPQPPTEDIPKKKQKKSKVTAQEATPLQQQPFSVTLEDASHPKDSGFFTFINVDPLLQPSYVLPTDSNTVQESQISTSQSAQNSKNAQYTCNLCDETFNREQKLLVHINTHYSKMDEDDQVRNDKSSRKRGKKS